MSAPSPGISTTIRPSHVDSELLQSTPLEPSGGSLFGRYVCMGLKVIATAPLSSIILAVTKYSEGSFLGRHVCMGLRVVAMAPLSSTTLAVTRYLGISGKLIKTVFPGCCRRIINRKSNTIEELKQIKDNVNVLRQRIAELEGFNSECDTIVRKYKRKADSLTRSIDEGITHLERLIPKVDSLAELLCIKSVTILHSSDKYEPAHVYGNSRNSVTVLPMNLKKLTEPELDFVIAHELSHLQFNILGVNMLTTAVLVTDCAVAYFLSPWAIFLVEAPVHYMFLWSLQNEERRADLAAISILNSAEGACSYFQKQIEEHKAKFAKGEVLISPEGNYIGDIYHPPLTVRLAYCEEMRTKLASSSPV